MDDDSMSGGISNSDSVPQLVSCKSVGPGHPQAELCNVCHGHYQPADFGVLACGHIFCLRCLLKLMQRAEDLCPTCRQPMEGLDRINFVPLIISLKTHFICFGCAKTEVSGEDVRWCMDCVELLCHDCEDKHPGHPIGSFDPVSVIQLIYQQFQAQSRHLKALYEEQKAQLDILANWVRDEFVWELIGECSRRIHDQYANKSLCDPKPPTCGSQDDDYHECSQCRGNARNLEPVRKSLENKYRMYIDVSENRLKRWRQLFGGCLPKEPLHAENKPEETQSEHACDDNAEGASAALDAALATLQPSTSADANVTPMDAATTSTATDAGAATPVRQSSFEIDATSTAVASDGFKSENGDKDKEKTLEHGKLNSLIRTVVPMFGRRLLSDLAKNDHSVDGYSTYLSTEALRSRTKNITRGIALDSLCRWSIPTLDSILSGRFEGVPDVALVGAGDNAAATGAAGNNGETNGDTSGTVEPPTEEPGGTIGSEGGGPSREVGSDGETPILTGVTTEHNEGSDTEPDEGSIFLDAEPMSANSGFQGRDAAVVQATGDIVIACEREGLWVFNHRAEFKLAPRCKNVEYDRTMRRVAANDDLILVGSIDGTLTVFHSQTLDHLGGCFALPDWVNESKCRMTMSRDNLYLLYGDMALYRISLELFKGPVTEERKILEEGSVHLVCSLPADCPAHDVAVLDDTVAIVTSTYPSRSHNDPNDSDDSSDGEDTSLRGKHQVLLYDGLNGQRILQKELINSVCRRYTSPHLAVDPTERLLFVSDDVHTMCFELPELKYRGRSAVYCSREYQAMVASRGRVYVIDLEDLGFSFVSYHQTNAKDYTATGIEYEPEQKPSSSGFACNGTL